MNKQIKLVGILIVIAAVFFWLVDPAGWFRPDADTIAEADPGRRVLCGLRADEITAFTITKPTEGSFRIEKHDDEWFVAMHDRLVKARAERIDGFLEDVPGLHSEALMTSKQEKHADFEVDDLTGIGLSVDTAGESDAVKLVVGKAAPGYKGAFVRVGTGTDVYRAEKNLKSLVGFSIDDYKTRNPWEFSTVRADKITLSPPDSDEPLVFQKTNGIWRKPGGGNANQNLLTELLDKFSKLIISKYSDETPAEESGFEGVEPRLVVSGAFGEVGITLGNMIENNYYATDATGSTYRVTEYNLKFVNELDLEEVMLDDVEETSGDDPVEEISAGDTGNPDG